MRLVVADTGPLNYLVLIDAIELLPKLFEKVFTPEAVRAELMHRDAPPIVRAWASEPPEWLEVRSVPTAERAHKDERLAFASVERAPVGSSMAAELVLMDDRAAVAIALQQGLAVTGTLGLLDLAARRGLVDLAGAFARLKGPSLDEMRFERRGGRLLRQGR
jgi:predicted nucleic acid-binding protein